jgi:arsenite/tail-anchored protein-transporting ATPase
VTQYIFFSGKGGVGKTTMAATKAVYQARLGKRTLLVSTDPAGNLGDIFEKDISTRPEEYAPNLFIAQMDSEAITRAYKDRMLEPLKEILDGLALEQVMEEFNSGCTVEIATFDKFTDFLSDDSYDLVVFDTAPTGHTLRLMTLPGEWSRFILTSSQGSGQTCIGPVSQIEDSRQKYERAVMTLQDASRTSVYLVCRPEKTSVYETLRAKKELERTGIHHFSLIINGVLPNHGRQAGIFSRLAQTQQKYISGISRHFSEEALLVPMQQSEIKGMDRMSLFGQVVFEKLDACIAPYFPSRGAFAGFAPGHVLHDLLAKKKETRLVVLTGKGGVGKTIAACALAMHLSETGKTILLTTDPAAHIGQVLEVDLDHQPRQIEGQLWAANIEQKQAVKEYRARILEEARQNHYSAEMMEALREELESPCTEEIAIFEQFSKLLGEPGWDYVVLDTAPTGHTMRLLELPFEYRDQLDMKNKKQGNTQIPGEGARHIEALIGRMKNPEETTFLLVAYPEYTPLHESHRALMDLGRVGISVQAVLLNHILNEQDCPPGFARERWKLQQHYLHQASEIFPELPLFNIPMQNQEISGMKMIKEISKTIFNQ